MLKNEAEFVLMLAIKSVYLVLQELIRYRLSAPVPALRVSYTDLTQPTARCKLTQCLSSWHKVVDFALMQPEHWGVVHGCLSEALDA